MRLVKVSNTERLELDNAHTNLKKIYRLGLKQAKISAVVQPISGVVMLLTIAIILGFGALEIGTGAITPGTLIAMIFYVIQLSMPLINLSTLVTDYKKLWVRAVVYMKLCKSLLNLLKLCQNLKTLQSSTAN